uniref:TonB-dependent receptor n=1 Tax=Eiseniibacteriota bacterium TaxID=2212470 RepID=A0A832I3A0_UNCEI
MTPHSSTRRCAVRRGIPLLFVVAASFLAASPAAAAPAGKVRGTVRAADHGEPLSFADLLLIPADSTQRRVGGLTNSDGTFELVAPPGLYSLQIRALSYARKVITGVRIEGGGTVEVNAALQSEAIVQKEVVVEARSIQNNDNAVLQARRKAAAVGDAVSAEQVRRTPDRDAADVLKRVTGLSVQDGKYVFVRGLGERYSSTEVDGVRLASPEANKRIVPLDLLPANLIDQIVVQKTYTADRPAEFGGGDVQVKTRDFPGRRTLALSGSLGYDDGTTGRRVPTYAGSDRDWLGFGAGDRELPAFVRDVAGDRKIVLRGVGGVGFTRDTIALLGRSFRNVWSPFAARAVPNGSLNLSYGDEWKVLGRSVGFVTSGNYSRSQNFQREYDRLFYGGEDVPSYEYEVARATESVQLGGVSALGVRMGPGHSLHGRVLYNRAADDETRVHEGLDHASGDVYLRGSRLLYRERSIFSAMLEGRHEFRAARGSRLDWKLSRSTANLLAPDRRDAVYQRTYEEDANGDPTIERWFLRSNVGGATREFGDQDDRGIGLDASWSVPLPLGSLGNGRATLGLSHQEKEREYFYRRFSFGVPPGQDDSAPPESLFQDQRWDGTRTSATLRDVTQEYDNYEAFQMQEAAFVSLDLPFARTLRGTFGLRAERGRQEIRNFDLFTRKTTAEGRLDDLDWLPSANLNLSLGESASLRAGASRTLSRPDIAELSPATDLEYSGGLRIAGNPGLKRARLDNWDLRFEVFPGLGEVLAVGGFYKRLYQPIERRILFGTWPYFRPENSDGGENLGLELEARFRLGRLWSGLDAFFLNANFSAIESEVRLRREVTVNQQLVHPLQGQADRLFNAALTWQPQGGRAELSLLVAHTGRRLFAIGVLPEPDLYDLPLTTLDATANLRVLPGVRLKLAGKNLTDAQVRREQGEGRIVNKVRPGTALSMALSFGS